MCEKIIWTNKDRKNFIDNLQTFEYAIRNAWINATITHYMESNLFMHSTKKNHVSPQY